MEVFTLTFSTATAAAAAAVSAFFDIAPIIRIIHYVAGPRSQLVRIVCSAIANMDTSVNLVNNMSRDGFSDICSRPLLNNFRK